MTKALTVMVVDDMEMMRKVTVGQLAAIGLAGRLKSSHCV
jgi:hypothetical protein